MKEKFKGFLAGNGALEKFEEYVADPEYCGLTEKILFSTHDSERYIVEAFPWAYTCEGSKYWYDLHFKWIELLQSTK